VEIEIGLDFAEAEREVEEQRRPASQGDYTLQVDAPPDLKASGQQSKSPGRPYLNWRLSIINDSSFQGKKVFYSTPLPWTNPTTQQLETSGINFLVDLTKALGKPWAGGKLQTEAYVGLTCKARVGVKMDNKGQPQNEVQLFY